MQGTVTIKGKIIPIFKCDASKDGSEWSFACPWCNGRHIHSAWPGHRVSHCSVRNEENQNGYFLKAKDN